MSESNDTHWLIIDSKFPGANLLMQIEENGGDPTDSLKEVHVVEHVGEMPEKRSLMQRIKEFLFDPSKMKPVEGNPYRVQKSVAGSMVTVDLQTGFVTVVPPGPILRLDFVTENLNRRPA